jgi:hypothetical protein
VLDDHQTKGTLRVLIEGKLESTLCVGRDVTEVGI